MISFQLPAIRKLCQDLCLHLESMKAGANLLYFRANFIVYYYRFTLFNGNTNIP